MLLPPELAAECNSIHETEMCLAPAELIGQCQGGIIRSHAPQKKNVLDGIAENGHVLGLVGKKFVNAYSISPPDEVEMTAEKIGINHASTFKGFCKHHDCSIFQPIEVSESSLNRRNCFLHCYRAVCREYYKLLIKVLVMKAHRTSAVAHNLPSDRIIFTNIMLHRAEHDCETMRTTKEKYDQILIGKSALDNFQYYLRYFHGEMNFVSLGCATPMFDFNGRIIHDEPIGSPASHLLCFATAKAPNGFSHIWGWISEHDAPSNKFIDSISHLNFESRNIAVVLSLLENSFWRESWWNRLPVTARNEMFQKLSIFTKISFERGNGYRLNTPDREFMLKSKLIREGKNIELV